MATQRSFITLDLSLGQVENLNPQGQAETGLNTGVTLNTTNTGITLDSGGIIKGGQTAYDTGTGFFLGYSNNAYQVSVGDPNGENLTWDGTNLTVNANTGGTTGNFTVGGYLAGPATFVIDPAAVGNNTGTVVIAGDLQVDGTTTTINSTTVTVDDKNLTLSSGSPNSAGSDGAGITIDNGSDTDATITWDGTNENFEFSHDVEVDGVMTATSYQNLPTIFTVIGRSTNTNISLSNGSFTVVGRTQNTTIGVV